MELGKKYEYLLYVPYPKSMIGIQKNNYMALWKPVLYHAVISPGLITWQQFSPLQCSLNLLFIRVMRLLVRWQSGGSSQEDKKTSWKRIWVTGEASTEQDRTSIWPFMEACALSHMSYVIYEVCFITAY